LTKDSLIKSEENGKGLAEPFTALRNNQADTLSSTPYLFTSSGARKSLAHSLPRALGLIAPSPIGLWSPEHDAEDDKRCDRNDGDNQSHLHSPLCTQGEG
jgi:hypothetical protein